MLIILKSSMPVKAFFPLEFKFHTYSISTKNLVRILFKIELKGNTNIKVFYMNQNIDGSKSNMKSNLP